MAMEDSMDSEDRLITEATVRAVGPDSDIDHLIGIHERIIRQQKAKRPRLLQELAGIRRSIEIREYAIELLREKAPAARLDDDRTDA